MELLLAEFEPAPQRAAGAAAPGPSFQGLHRARRLADDHRALPRIPFEDTGADTIGYPASAQAVQERLSRWSDAGERYEARRLTPLRARVTHSSHRRAPSGTAGHTPARPRSLRSKWLNTVVQLSSSVKLR